MADESPSGSTDANPPTEPPDASAAGAQAPPPTGSPSSTVPPQAAAAPAGGPATGPATGSTGPAGAQQQGAQQQGAWYSGPWPAPGMKTTESAGAVIGKAAIMSFTALVIILGLPVVFLIAMIAGLAGLGAASAGGGDDAAAPIFSTEYVAGERSGDTRLVAVPVIGPILGEDRGGGGGFFSAAAGVTYGYSVKETLLELADDDDVDGVLLELDSPGGTIFGSKAIADGVAEYQARTGKPVLAYVGGISASGGMYAMAGADEIVADHGTLIGSIGVIFGPFVRYNDITAVDNGILFGGVETSGGVEFEFLTAGRSKDLGSPYRDMTAEERKTLEEGLDNAYDDFVAHVADGRDLIEAEIENDLGALIYGEQQAQANGLIDTIGSREEAWDRLAELAGADGGNWRLDRSLPGEPSFLDLLVGATADEADPAARVNLPSVCTGTATLLTFHGDPSQLCDSLRSAQSE